MFYSLLSTTPFWSLTEYDTILVFDGSSSMKSFAAKMLDSLPGHFVGWVESSLCPKFSHDWILDLFPQWR